MLRKGKEKLLRDKFGQCSLQKLLSNKILFSGKRCKLFKPKVNP
jgi:hypothetical protein